VAYTSAVTDVAPDVVGKTMKQVGGVMIICCCEQAYKDCEYDCVKGRYLKPVMVYSIPRWKKRIIKYKRRKK
jgi:hypothetical protein